jgi:thioredoxin-related protein
MIAKKLLKSAVVRWSLPVLLLWCLPSQAAELLMFERDGCIWCQRWNQAVGPVYDKTEAAARLPLRRINVDRQASLGLTLASKVVYTPTFIVVDGGHEVGRITGYINDDAFWGLLDSLVDRLGASHPPNTRRQASYHSAIAATR